MKILQIGFLFGVLLSLTPTIQAQPADHPPVPQIDRTDNARQSQLPATAPSANHLDIDFAGMQYYKLVGVEAVDIHSMHTTAEMDAFQKEAAGEFAKTAIAIDWDAGKWYIKSKQDAGRETAIAFKVVDKTLAWIDCKKCQDALYTIIEVSSSSLVLQLSPQDEGQHFVYQFHFTK